MLRPGNAEECCKQLEAAVVAGKSVESEQCRQHALLCEGMSLLMETSWLEDFVKPLYNKNLMVRLGFNSLTPAFRSVLVDPPALERDAAAGGKDVRRLLAIDESFCDLRESCELHRERSATETLSDDFIRLRLICEKLCDGKIKDALCVLLRSNATALKIWKDVMVPRIAKSFRTDNKIEASDDPLPL